MALRSSKGMVLTLTVTVLFVMMVTELIAYGVINLNYDSIAANASSAYAVEEFAAGLNSTYASILPSVYAGELTMGSYSNALIATEAGKGISLSINGPSAPAFSISGNVVTGTYNAVVSINSTYVSITYPINAIASFPT